MSYEQMQNNKAYISGEIYAEPIFSHEVLGEGFYDVVISVKRLSGQDDLIPVTMSERIMEGRSFEIGEKIGASGQIRSYNKIINGKSKLVLRIFAREIDDGDEENPNIIELEGYVCKPPIYRTTPFKREITDMLVAVNRAYNKSDYIPVIAWGRNARYAGNFQVGDRIVINGRIQSRIYQKQLDDGTVEERTAYEVSVSRLTAVESSKRTEQDQQKKADFAFELKIDSSAYASDITD